MSKPMTRERMLLNIGMLVIICGGGFVATVDWAASVSPSITMEMWFGLWAVLWLVGVYWAREQHREWAASASKQATE